MCSLHSEPDAMFSFSQSRFFFVCIVWIEEAEANYSLVVLCRCIFCVSTVNCSSLYYLCCVLHALLLYLCCVADTTSANYKVVEEALSPPSMASIERHTRLFQRRIEGFDPCCSSFYKETHWSCKRRRTVSLERHTQVSKQEFHSALRPLFYNLSSPTSKIS